MLQLGEIFRAYAKTYLQQFQPPVQHTKVIKAICNCRTAALGGHAWSCTSCGSVHVHYNSCGNRHCPQCQAFEKEKWVEARKAELLPVSYLHVVFTIPAALNKLVLSNDRLIYSLLFKAAWATIRQVAQDKRWLGGQTGMLAVLHTWGSNLSLHPHLHCIIPCGGLNADQTVWLSTTKKNFLAPNKKVIAPIFKGIFMKHLIKAFEEERLFVYGSSKVYEDTSELNKLFSKLYQKNWNVYAKKPFGGPAQILKYLSRYTHRIAISNHRILSVKGDKITFSVKDYKKKDKKGAPVVTTLTLGVLEFIRRFLLHILPKGFQRIRYFGILAIRNRKTKLKAAQKALAYTPPVRNPLNWKERLKELTGVDPDACPFCKQKTLELLGHIVQQFLPIGRAPPVRIKIVTPEGEYIPFAV